MLVLGVICLRVFMYLRTPFSSLLIGAHFKTFAFPNIVLCKVAETQARKVSSPFGAVISLTPETLCYDFPLLYVKSHLPHTPTFSLSESDRLDLALLDLDAFPATMEELKQAFRQVASKYHPDTGGSHDAWLKFHSSHKRLTQRYL